MLSSPPRSSRPVAIWLLIGVGMIIMQVLLGGITRLTGSGLSITEWKPVLGALPPLNEHEWNIAFEKYKQIAQYRYLNSHFSLHDFKFIFFWEWLHRLWARLIGVVFLVPFIVFWIQKRFSKQMIRPMIILFLLGALQGLVGWIMVESGLEGSDRLYVDHYKLAIHFILALGLLCYTVWFACELLIKPAQIVTDRSSRKWINIILQVLVLQLIYGAFMSGLKAASTAPTWPKINGSWFPSPVHSFGDRQFIGLSFLTDNPIVVQFIHRSLAYILLILVIAWWWRTTKISASSLFRKVSRLPLLIILIQGLLGVFTVLKAGNTNSFLWLAVAHQFTGMLLLISIIWIIYLLRSHR